MGELIIYIIWERDQTDADVNSTRIKERLITMCQTQQLTKGPPTRCFVYLQKILGGCSLINQNTPRQCCSHTSWGYSNCKQIMSNSTESNGSFDKECPTGSSNESFSLHQHDAQDNNSWSKWPWLPLCIVVQFNGPKTLITLKNSAASNLLSIKPVRWRVYIWINSSNIRVHPYIQHCLDRHKICSTKVLRNQH